MFNHQVQGSHGKLQGSASLQKQNFIVVGDGQKLFQKVPRRKNDLFIDFGIE
jgi:hypothetical protein